MKSKKSLIFVWVICLMLVVAVMFVACNKKQQAPEQPSHEHSWATAWSKDSTGHWHACGGCDEKKDFAAHVYSDDHDATCNVCGYERSLGDHVASTSWTADASGHWNVCMHDGCTLVYNESEHVYTDEHDATCNVCGYERDLGHEHSWEGSWSKDATNHWHECSTCGEKKDSAAHVYDDEHDTTCNVCGYVRDIAHEHSWAGGWSNDATNHWHACSTCDEKKDLAAHVYDDGHDAICNVCGYERDLSDHVASTSWTADESGHWNVCMHEGCTIVYNESEHVYSDAHDAICNVCGYERDLSDHVASTSWTADASGHWNVCMHEGCTIVYNESAHVYDNDHDATCNVCGYVRELGDHAAGEVQSDADYHWNVCTHDGCELLFNLSEHEFDDDHDAICDACGYERVLGDHAPEAVWSRTATKHWYACTHDGCELKFNEGDHEYDNDHDTTCNVCGYVRDIGDHAAASDWSSDQTHHWKACEASNCDFKYSYSAHTFSDGVCTVCGEGQHTEGLQFTLQSGEYVVTGYTGTATDVVIRSIYCGKSVTGIDGSVFKNNTALTSITLPNSVTSIGQSAFEGCTLLASVTLGNGVESIGSDAFNGCVALTGITIPGTMTSIGTRAFQGCTQLASATIGNGVEIIDYYAFAGCTKLTSITIPNSVTSIGYGAFNGCTKLANVTLGSGLESIGYYAFNGCTELTSITIPDSVTSIGGSAFQGCDHLASVTLGNHVESIGGSAFAGCTLLTSIELPNSMTSIGGFSDSNLYSITIPNSATSIEADAFSNSGLTSITIPNSVTSIGDRAFKDCANLTTVTLGNHVESIGNNAFTNCILLESITIPNSVTSVGLRAFQGCDKLTTANIGNGVTTIEADTFKSCAKLENVSIGTGVTSIGLRAFDSCTKLKSITYAGTIAQWNAISKATGWKNSQLTTIHCSDGDTTP